MKKPGRRATSTKWERVHELINNALARLAAEGHPATEDARAGVKKAEEVARLFTSRAGTREETSAGLAIVEVLEHAYDAKPQYLAGALFAARRLVAREAALSVVRNTQRRYIEARGVAKTDDARERRNRAVGYALRSVWDALRKGRS